VHESKQGLLNWELSVLLIQEIAKTVIEIKNTACFIWRYLN
jgi:hypothetical protein